jgi:flagellar motor protein MotB
VHERARDAAFDRLLRRAAGHHRRCLHAGQRHVVPAGGGGWQLSAAGEQAIARLVHKLAPTQQNKLYVSGFTDSTPIGPELAAKGIASNQELSQMRADAVMQFLISQGMKPPLVAANGFGDADPVASNDTEEGRAKNRRVELSLYPL